MNLEEFNSLALTTEKSASHILHAIITSLDSNKANENLILTYFESIPFALKHNESLTEYVFMTFFNKYDINEKNIYYYTTYIKENHHKLSIIDKNPDWHWETKIFQYDTLKELLMNLESETSRGKDPKQYPSAALQFIKENKSSFQKFNKASHKKFEAALIKKNVFKTLQSNSYRDFKDFCEAYDFDCLDIMQKVYVKPYSEHYEGYGFAELIRHMSYDKLSNDNLKEALHDILLDKEKFFGPNNQFLNLRDNNVDSANHVCYVFMQTIVEDRFDMAVTLLENFKSEILEGLTYFYKDSYRYAQNKETIPEEISPLLLENARKKLKNYSYHGAFHIFERFDEKKLGQFENYYNLFKNQNKPTKNKI